MQALSTLWLIAKRARRDKALKFTALMHHITEEMLREGFKKLRKDAACGIDGITVKEYSKDLTTNIKRILERLKIKAYKPKAVRRVYIPKPGKKELRPLGIPSVEDKLVQMAAQQILETLLEPVFKDSSHGFRPQRGCHTAIRQLDQVVMNHPTNYIDFDDIVCWVTR